MGSLAEELKTEREKRNVPLAQIAEETRISLHYLESLEAGRYEELPGGMYNRAFIRAFCECLDLNEKEMLRRYEEEVESFADKIPKSRTRSSQSGSSIKLNPLLLWGLALLVSSTGIFFSRGWIAEVFSPYFSRRPTATLTPASKPQPLVSPSTYEIPAPDTSLQPEPTSPSVPPDSQVSGTMTHPAEMHAEGFSGASPHPQTQVSIQLEIGATEQCWVSIEQDGNRTFRKLMGPGDVQQLKAAEQFFVILGNAGGVQLKLNGRRVKPLGKPGEVVKILINEKNLPSLLDQSAG